MAYCIIFHNLHPLTKTFVNFNTQQQKKKIVNAPRYPFLFFFRDQILFTNNVSLLFYFFVCLLFASKKPPQTPSQRCSIDERPSVEGETYFFSSPAAAKKRRKKKRSASPAGVDTRRFVLSYFISCFISSPFTVVIFILGIVRGSVGGACINNFTFYFSTFLIPPGFAPKKKKIGIRAYTSYTVLFAG